MADESWFGDLIRDIPTRTTVERLIEEHTHRDEALTLNLAGTPFPGVPGPGGRPEITADYWISEEEVDRYGAIQVRSLPPGTSQTNPFVMAWPSSRVNIRMVFFLRGNGWLRIMTTEALLGRGRTFANRNRTVLMANGAGTQGQFNSLTVLATDPARLSSIPFRPDIDDAVGNATTDQRGLGEVATGTEVQDGVSATDAGVPLFVTAGTLKAELDRRIGVPAIPDPPTISSVTSSAFSVEVEDDAVANKWRMRWREGTSGSWTNVAEQTSRNFRVTGRRSGTAHQVEVAAGNATGWSNYSDPATATTTAVVPTTPGRPSISLITASSFRATAPSGGGATKWRAQWRVGSSGGWTDVAEQTSRFFDVSGLSARTTHQVRVAAGNAAGWSSYGPAAQVTTTSGLPGRPSAPTISNRTSSGFRVTAAAGGSGITQYRAQYRQGTSGGWTALAAQTGRIWNVTGRPASTSHQVQVAVRNAVGWSPWSSSATATTTAAPPGRPSTPSSLTLTPSRTSVRGTIAAVSGSGVWYEWARSSSGPWTRIAGSGRSFTVTGLSPNTRITLYGRARNSTGPSGSVSASTRTTVPPPASAPVVTWTVTTSTITYNLSSVLYAETYERQGRVSTTWISMGSSRRFVIGNLAPGTSGTLRFRARNSAGAGPASAYITATTAQVFRLSLRTVSAVEIALSDSGAPAGAARFQDRYRAASGSYTSWRTSFQDIRGLAPSTRYTVQRRALSSGGAVLATATASITTPSVPTPTIHTLNVRPGSVAGAYWVSWSMTAQDFIYGIENRHRSGSGAWSAWRNTGRNGLAGAGVGRFTVEARCFIRSAGARLFRSSVVSRSRNVP